MTDDISMHALSGDARSRAGRRDRAPAAISCFIATATSMEMIEVAAGVPELAGDALRRTDAALALRRPAEEVDRRALEARFDSLLAQAAAA